MDKFNISLPRDTLTNSQIKNLRALVFNHDKLIKKSLDTTSLAIKVTDEEIVFPWFKIPDSADETQAYMQFVSMLCQEASSRKEIHKHKVKDSGNDKYSFRCFLVRLGFVGPEYKKSRAVLLKNLSGNAAFRAPRD